MWQHHYAMHQMHMEELRAEADRERRWHLQDLENSRRSARSAPGRARVLAARAVATVSRSTARIARRLDAGVTVEIGADRLVRDA